MVYVRHNATHLLNVNKALLQSGLADVADFPNEFDPTKWHCTSIIQPTWARLLKSRPQRGWPAQQSSFWFPSPPYQYSFGPDEGLAPEERPRDSDCSTAVMTPNSSPPVAVAVVAPPTRQRLPTTTMPCGSIFIGIMGGNFRPRAGLKRVFQTALVGNPFFLFVAAGDE